MNLTRRNLAVAGVFALSATTLIMPAMAATDDEGAVKQAVEALRKAILAQDKATLEMLAAEQLSYSHSDAHLEDKTKFINAIMTRKAVLKSLDFPDLTVAIVGNNAIVRHLWVSESELDGIGGPEWTGDQARGVKRDLRPMSRRSERCWAMPIGSSRCMITAWGC